ncbi:MAG: hypothetical protein GX047_01145 [Firmicutes bacterium]|nr:hypothetical protein [Bacillota bacterium]
MSKIRGLNRYDPYVKVFRGENVDLIEPVLDDADLVLILTDHEEFRRIDVNDVAQRVRTKLVFDTRNCLDRDVWEKAGFICRLLGDGTGLEILGKVERETAVT